MEQYIILLKTTLRRIHSSGMHTAHYNSHPGGSPPGTPSWSIPSLDQAPLGADPPDQPPPSSTDPHPGPGTPQPWSKPPPEQTSQSSHPPPVDRILGTRLRKYYFVCAGNNICHNRAKHINQGVLFYVFVLSIVLEMNRLAIELEKNILIGCIMQLQYSNKVFR